jgi:hypothetical protein
MAPEITPRRSQWKAAVLASAGIILGGIALYYAASGEITGKTFVVDTQDKHVLFAPVSRENDPNDFRHANNLLWLMSILGFGIGAGGIWHYRDLRDCD